MKKPLKIFHRSFWSLSTLFFAILFAIFMIGENIAMSYAGWINSYLDCETTIKVDNSADETPDVLYYKPDFMQYRWHYNKETQKYEFQKRWNQEGLYSYIKNVAKNVDTEGTVLLKNDNSALPLKKGAKISLFGTSQFSNNYITTGQGSGYHAANTSDTLRSLLLNEGIEINDNLYNAYERINPNYKPTMFNTFPNGDLNYVEFKVNEIPLSEIESAMNSTLGNSQFNDSAIYIISRLGSENGDTDFSAPNHVDNNYMDLNNDEKNILNKLTEYKNAGKLKSIVLVLNTCNAMQFKSINQYPIDAILWTGTGGTSSFRALSEVLTGKADPNGRLADTYLYDNYSAPSTINTGDFTYAKSNGVPAKETYAHNNKYVVYQEGIYVGYKYYETRYEDMVMNRGNAIGSFGMKNSPNEWLYQDEVIYPFGHGSSYASFEHSNFKVTENKGKIYAEIKIKNISETYSGKDTFQLYIQKPYTEYDQKNKLEKASVELAGFAKTRLLKPGEEQTLKISLSLRDLTSYDSYGQGTYILEKGDYYLSFGNDSHDALNNIIAKKGAVNTKYVDGNGNANFVYQLHIDEDDFTTYSTSEVTKEKIVNHFNDADLNLYENTQDQKITYLSRKDWANTYPTKPISLTCENSQMVKDMQYGKDIENDGSCSLPTYGADNGLSLIDLMYEDYNSEKWDKLLDQLTIEDQKNLILMGANSLEGVGNVNAPGGNIHDGPAGIRDAVNSIAYPGQTIMASTFNTDLIYQLGEAFGMEMQYLGYVGLYGPGANIHRNAFGGRNFEYFSEDSVLSGLILDAELRGLTDMGIITYTKHFALNDQERNRYGVCVWANEQTIREIYLKAFQYSIENEKCGTVGLMSSFNRFGCTWSGAHKGLLTDVLRKEWGFKGSVMTDAAVGGYMGAGGNQKAVASAIVAGQTIWLSDLRAQGFGSFTDNPVIAQAIRQACKENLYAQLRSSAMNGMKSGIMIVEVTPWWQKAIRGGQIGVGIVTGLCLSMAIASFVVVNLAKKKERNDEE